MLFPNKHIEGQVRPPPNIPFAKRTRIFVGTRCGYHCEFCYYRFSTYVKNIPDLVYRQLDFVKAYGMLDVEFTGGEPTIDKHLLDYIKYAKKIGLRRICVITNGVNLHRKPYLKSLIEAGLDEVLVSLHGADEENHIEMTGVKSSWKTACKTIENVNNTSLLLRINCVVTKDNYDRLPEHADNIKKYDVVGMNYLPLNMWDDTITSGVNVAYSKMAPYIRKAISKLKGHVPFISVRFIPFCHMEGYEEYVCNWFQQPYDHWDWNNELIDLADREQIRCPNDPFGHAELMRKNIYTKYNKCLYCKYFIICDGIEKAGIKENTSVKPVKGDLIYDPMYWRRFYCDEQMYHRYIDPNTQ